MTCIVQPRDLAGELPDSGFINSNALTAPGKTASRSTRSGDTISNATTRCSAQGHQRFSQFSTAGPNVGTNSHHAVRGNAIPVVLVQPARGQIASAATFAQNRRTPERDSQHYL